LDGGGDGGGGDDGSTLQLKHMAGLTEHNSAVAAEVRAVGREARKQVSKLQSPPGVCDTGLPSTRCCYAMLCNPPDANHTLLHLVLCLPINHLKQLLVTLAMHSPEAAAVFAAAVAELPMTAQSVECLMAVVSRLAQPSMVVRRLDQPSSIVVCFVSQCVRSETCDASAAPCLIQHTCGACADASAAWLATGAAAGRACPRCKL
jgi:hypothetical protein